jgi:hypothetical protein
MVDSSMDTMLTVPLNPTKLSKPNKAESSALLQRVVESTPFRRATRLRDFLVYVGNEALNDVEEIHEQQIGIAVFERPIGYDTAQDNIVRVNAMEVRKRIELYFANEGKEESLVLEIPRGTYIPLFVARKPELSEVLVEREASVTREDGFSPSPSPDLARTIYVASSAWALNSVGYVLLVFCIGLTAWASFETVRNHGMEASLHVWESGPSLRAFWGNFFGKGQPPEIVLADTSFTLAQEVSDQPLSLAEYLDYRYRHVQSLKPLSADARKQQASDLAMIFAHNNGSIGDFRVSRRISELETGGGATRLVYARDYSGHALRRGNTILLGSGRSNPWTELFESQMGYHFTYAQDSTQSYVQVDHPLQSEAARYPWSSDPTAKVGYCLIALLPNLTNTGSTLILAGSDSQATEAGGDFITSEESLKNLLVLFHRNSFPHFQVLLRVSRLSGTPLKAEILSYRTDSK